MKSKKVILFSSIVIFILTIIGISYLVFTSQKERIEYYVKKTLIYNYNIKDKINCKIRIDKIEGAFFNKIILSRVSIINIANNSIIKIDKIVAKYSLWSYLSKKSKGLKVYEVKLYRPYICLSKDKEQRWNWENLLSLKEIHIREYPKIVIKNGLLRIINSSCNLNFTLQKVNFLLNPQENSSPFVLSSVLGEKEKGSFHLVGNINRLCPLATDFKLIFNNIYIKKFENLFQNYIEKINDGYLSGEIIGLANETDEGRYCLSYKGRYELSKGSFKLYHLQNPIENVSLEGNFRKNLLDKKCVQFFPSQIYLNLQEAFYKKIPFSGSIKSNPSFTKISLTSFKITFLNLSKLLNLNEKSLIFKKIRRTQGDLIVKAQYRKEEGSWRGDINYQNLVTTKEDSLPSLSTKFKYKNHKIDIFDFSWEKGVFLAGKIDLQKNPFLKINLQFKEMPLKNTLKIFKLTSPKLFKHLRLNGYIDFYGNLNKYSYKSLLEINDKDREKSSFNQLKLIFNGTKGENIFGCLSLNNFNINKHFINSEITFQGQREETDAIRGQLKVKEIVINDVDLGCSNYEIYWQNDTLKVTTLSNEIGIFIESSLKLDKEKILDAQLDAQINLSNLNLPLIIHALKLKEYTPLKAYLFGKVKLIKKPQKPFLATAERLELKHVSFNEHKLNNFDLTFSCSDKNLHIIDLSAEDQKINLTGDIKFRDFQAKEADIILNTKLLSIYHSKLNSTFNINKKDKAIKVSGDAELIFKESLYDLQDIKAEIREDKSNKIKITKLTSKINKTGQLNLYGEVDRQKKDVDLNFYIKDISIQSLPFPVLAKSSGNLDIKGRIKDNIERPQIDFNFKTNLVKINNKLCKNFKGEAIFTKDKILEFKTIDLAEKICLKGSINFTEAPEIDACLFFNDEKLANIFNIFTPLKKAEGIIDGKIFIKERLSNPKFLVRLEAKNMEVGKIQADKAKVELDYFDKIVTPQKIYLTQKSGFLELKKGSIYLDSKENSFLNVNLENFKFPGTFLSGEIKLFGKGNFYENKYTGDIKAINVVFNKKLKVKTICSQFVYKQNVLYLLNYGKQPGILGKVSFFLPDKVVIDRLCYIKDKIPFIEAKGNIAIKEEKLDINLQAFDSILKIIPEHTKVINLVNGKLTANMNIKGTFDHYHINGNLDLQDGEIVTSWKNFNRYTKIQAKVIISDYRIKLEELKFNLNEGTVNSYGEIIIPEKKININLNTEKFMKFYIPLKIDTKLTANLNLNGNYDAPTCKGTIEFFDTNFTYTGRLGKKEHIFNNINFDLKLLAKSNVRYYNDYVKCTIDNSWIKLLGYPGKFKIVGLFESRKGYIEYLGTRFLINKAELEFREGERRPYLFGEAQTKIGNVLVLLNYYGKLFVGEPMLSTPNIYPPKTKEEIVGMLRMGRDYKNIKSTEIDVLLRMGLARIIGTGLNSNIIRPLESNLTKLLKVDVDIRIPYLSKIFLKEDDKDSSELKKDISEETIFSFGKYLTDDLYFNYRGALAGKKKESMLSQEFELEYYHKPGEILKYKYLPGINGKEEEEHEISVKKEIRF